MTDKLPPRSWRRHWSGYLGHGLIGVAVALGIFLGGVWLVLAITGLVIQLTYQGLSFLRKRDTPGRDVGDVFAGYLIAIIVIVGLILWRSFRLKSKTREPSSSS